MTLNEFQEPEENQETAPSDDEIELPDDGAVVATDFSEEKPREESDKVEGTENPPENKFAAGAVPHFPVDYTRTSDDDGDAQHFSSAELSGENQVVGLEAKAAVERENRDFKSINVDRPIDEPAAEQAKKALAEEILNKDDNTK